MELATQLTSGVHKSGWIGGRVAVRYIRCMNAMRRVYLADTDRAAGGGCIAVCIVAANKKQAFPGEKRPGRDANKRDFACTDPASRCVLMCACMH